MQVTFADVANCLPMCTDATRFNGTHPIPFWKIDPDTGSCVWAANGPGVYDPDCPHRALTLPFCIEFLVQVILTPDGDDVIARVEATSGSAAHAEWEMRVGGSQLDCHNLGSIPLARTPVPCVTGTYAEFGSATCSVGT